MVAVYLIDERGKIAPKEIIVHLDYEETSLKEISKVNQSCRVEAKEDLRGNIVRFDFDRVGMDHEEERVVDLAIFVLF